MPFFSVLVNSRTRPGQGLSSAVQGGIGQHSREYPGKGEVRAVRARYYTLRSAKPSKQPTGENPVATLGTIGVAREKPPQINQKSDSEIFILLGENKKTQKSGVLFC